MDSYENWADAEFLFIRALQGTGVNSVVNYKNVHVSYSECMKLVFFIAFFYQ